MIWKLFRGVTLARFIWRWSKLRMRVVLDNITHNYQRPPSVGMPRHALRRRMPNSATGRPYLLGGRKFFFSAKSLPLGEGPRMASSSAWLPAKSGTKKHDLKIGPSEIAHFLHAALKSIYKNKVLLTFCRKNIFCWPKITFFMPKWPFFHIFQLWELISRSQVPGAVRTWTAILLSVVNGVRGQILV